ncbi:MAG TPA: hypothetical protein VEI52_12405 [Terriglobales bacterium]|nr:hypothetical protein [Terriglobales bacterium]
MFGCGEFSNYDVHLEPFHLRVSTNGMRYRPAFSEILEAFDFFVLVLLVDILAVRSMSRNGSIIRKPKSGAGQRLCAPDVLGSDVAVLATHGARVLIHILFSNLALMDTRRSEPVISAQA